VTFAVLKLEGSPLAGFSGKSLIQKLGIKAGVRLGIFEAPTGFDATLGQLPDGVTKTTTLRGSHDVVLLFAKSKKPLETRFDEVAKVVAPAGSFWVCWPKKTSGVLSDLDENIVRAVGLNRGWVDIKVCAIDDIWSGLKFVTRLSHRV
jgi:hypothetical protein